MRLLVDPDPALEQLAPEPSCEPGRVHRRAELRQQTAVEHRRIDEGAHLVAVDWDDRVEQTEPVRRDHDVGPRSDLSGRGRDRQGAVGSEPRIDVVLVEEPADAIDALLALAADPERRIVTEAVDDEVQVVPERVDEPTVAAARSTAADVLLQDHHVDAGIELLQEPRGPHAGVAAAEDHDVRFGVGVERRARVAGELRARERFAQPPAPPLVRRQRVHGPGWYRPSANGPAMTVGMVPGLTSEVPCLIVRAAGR